MADGRRDPPDAPARRRIVEDLETTLFVEAGAGSGKTTALVNRVLALVTAGGVPLGSIAAITFTEKAATELRDRLRSALERCAAGEAGGEDPAVAERARAALDELDRAAIGTLHAFAQRLLTEHPIEAGLPPRIEVLDEVSSGIEFERRWATFRDRLLADGSLERTLLLFFATGVQPDALRQLALAFDRSWDLVADRVPDTAPEPPDVHTLVQPALAALDAATAHRAACRSAADKLCLRLDELAAYAERLRGLDDELALLAAIDPRAEGRPSFAVGGTGAKANWDESVRDAARAAVGAAEEALAAARDRVTRACAERIGAALRRFTLAAAAERQAAGRLEFHDLLVLGRELLRDPDHGPGVRARLHERYRRLLLDEFQDTDPIQIELAVRIAAADPEAPAAGTDPWDEVPVAAGHLFVVGDPKQSIYRFRRADIGTFLAAQDRFGGDGLVELTANFRTGGPVIGWVNHVFATLMGEPVELELPVASQPAYVALDAVRPAPPAGPGVAVMGRKPHGGGTRADELRAREAADVAAVIRRAVTERWQVGDRGDDGADRWRDVTLGDIAVLIPARTSLPFLEDALDDAGIAYRTESSSLVYASRAVRDVLMVLRAVDDPTNHLHVVSALRTPLLACGDDDLFRFKVERRGRWGYLGDQPDSVPPDDPVRAGLAYLAELHAERRWRSPAQLLERVVRDRRALELGFAEGRPRDVWRRLRFVVDQARAWCDATHGGLRDYLHWVAQQTAEGARVAEAVLPETDHDAVRILTIHAAKGLEFPVTILSGLSTAGGGRRAAAEVVFPPGGGVGYGFGSRVRTQAYTEHAPVDEQMGYDERIRLLYVACTRARDHLVVSLHRCERATEPAPRNRTNAELLVAGMGEAGLAGVPDAVPATGMEPAEPLTADRPPPPPPRDQWRAERDEALARAGRPTTVAATALTDEGAPDVEPEPHREADPGLQKRPRDLDLPPWLKGRYGTAVGRAVHGVLQTVDLAGGADLDAAVAAQCEAEAIPERAGDVRRLAAAALSSPAVRAAATAPHWRETYVCTPLGDRLLEGYVDLLYRTGDGLVLVDHKTAATADPAELDRRLAAYRNQGAAYALAVREVTGERVARVTFLFLTPDGAVERHLEAGELDTAVAEVRRLVLAGEEVVTA